MFIEACDEAIKLNKCANTVLVCDGSVENQRRSDIGFQHFPRDLGYVNEWKIIFNSSNEKSAK